MSQVYQKGQKIKVCGELISPKLADYQNPNSLFTIDQTAEKNCFIARVNSVDNNGELIDFLVAKEDRNNIQDEVMIVSKSSFIDPDNVTVEII